MSKNALETMDAFNDATTASADEFDPHELDGNATEGLDPDKTNWAIPVAEPPYKCFPVRKAR